MKHLKSKSLEEGLYLVHTLAEKSLLIVPESPTSHMIEAVRRVDKISRRRIKNIYKTMMANL